MGLHVTIIIKCWIILFYSTIVFLRLVVYLFFAMLNIYILTKFKYFVLKLDIKIITLIFGLNHAALDSQKQKN